MILAPRGTTTPRGLTTPRGTKTPRSTHSQNTYEAGRKIPAKRGYLYVKRPSNLNMNKKWEKR